MKHLRQIAFIFICFYSISAYSQPNFRPGFIITNDKDTVLGKIDYRNDLRMCKVCSFKNKVTEEKIEYAPEEIFGYGFTGGRYFETDTLNGKTKFFEVLIRGEISIYYYTDLDNDLYFLKKGYGDLIELEYFEKEVYFDGSGRASDGKKYSFANDSVKGIYLIRSQEFIKILQDTLINQPEIANDILEIRKPNHRELIKLADKYHDLERSNMEKAIHHNLHINSNLEFSIGWTNINFSDFRKGETYRIFGLKGYVPLAYNRFFLGVGIEHASFNTYHNSCKLFRVPLSFRYQYPGHIIKPYAALGINLYTIDEGFGYFFVKDYIIAYNMGIAVKVYKNLSLSLNIEGDILNNPYINSNEGLSFSQTKSVGIMVNF